MSMAPLRGARKRMRMAEQDVRGGMAGVATICLGGWRQNQRRLGAIIAWRMFMRNRRVWRFVALAASWRRYRAAPGSDLCGAAAERINHHGASRRSRRRANVSLCIACRSRGERQRYLSPFGGFGRKAAAINSARAS